MICIRKSKFISSAVKGDLLYQSYIKLWLLKNDQGKAILFTCVYQMYVEVLYNWQHIHIHVLYQI